MDWKCIQMSLLSHGMLIELISNFSHKSFNHEALSFLVVVLAEDEKVFFFGFSLESESCMSQMIPIIFKWLFHTLIPKLYGPVLMKQNAKIFHFLLFIHDTDLYGDIWIIAILLLDDSTKEDPRFYILTSCIN